MSVIKGGFPLRLRKLLRKSKLTYIKHHLERLFTKNIFYSKTFTRDFFYPKSFFPKVKCSINAQ